MLCWLVLHLFCSHCSLGQQTCKAKSKGELCYESRRLCFKQRTYKPHQLLGSTSHQLPGFRPSPLSALTEHWISFHNRLWNSLSLQFSLFHVCVLDFSILNSITTAFNHYSYLRTKSFLAVLQLLLFCNLWQYIFTLLNQIPLLLHQIPWLSPPQPPASQSPSKQNNIFLTISASHSLDYSCGW